MNLILYAVTVSNLIDKLNFYSNLNCNILDETIEKEQKEFSKTLQEEVFNKKVGQNPMFILKPEEIPIIAEILNQEEDNQKQVGDLRQPFQPEMITHKINATTSHGYSDDDDDIRPENYFFTS